MPLEELEKKLYRPAVNAAEEKIKEDTAPAQASKEETIKKGWGRARTAASKKRLELGTGKPDLLADFFKKIKELKRFGRWLIWIAGGGIIVLIIISGFYAYQYFTSQGISFSVESPKETAIGAPFNLKLRLDNQSKNALQKIKLKIALPEDIVAIINNQIKRGIIIQDVDDLESGGSLQQELSFIPFGDKQTIKRFRVSFSYIPSGLGGRLEKSEEIQVNARESAIKLGLMTPQKVFNNEEFPVLIRYSNISGTDLGKARIKITFPSGFILKESNPKISEQGFWWIDDLAKGVTGEFSIKGKIIRQEGDFFEIKSEAELSISNQLHKINEETARISIAASPLSLRIIINNKPLNYIAGLGENLNYELIYNNNTDVGLTDAVIKARLIGEMFNFSYLGTNGFFSSLDNTITWNAANTPELRLLPPGAAGKVNLEIRTKDNFPIKKKSDKNFSLKIQAEITSPTVPNYVAADKSIGLSALENKIAGAIQIESQAYFEEPTLYIKNKGSLPPKVNTPINFTIHWLINNYATDVRDVKIKSFLLSGTRWTGVVKSNIESAPIYNEKTQEIIWSIDKIAATRGVISQPIEAIFQIEAIPSITQLNQEIPLLSETRLEALDEFTGLTLGSVAEFLRTGLLQDAGLEWQNTKVIQ